jgi:hypothetical protein
MSQEPDLDVLKPTFDASDEKQIENAKRRASRVAKEDSSVVEAILSTREGRSWYWRKMESASVFGNPIGADTHATYWNLGMQNFGKVLLAEAQRHGELYATMAKESAR